MRDPLGPHLDPFTLFPGKTPEDLEKFQKVDYFKTGLDPPWVEVGVGAVAVVEHEGVFREADEVLNRLRRDQDRRHEGTLPVQEVEQRLLIDVFQSRALKQVVEPVKRKY